MRTHTYTHTYTHMTACMHTHSTLQCKQSKGITLFCWKRILQRANWISPGSLKKPYHGEHSHHVIIRFIEAHSFNLPPFCWAHCIHRPGQKLRDKGEPRTHNTWKSHKDLASFVTETEQDFVCVNNVAEWGTRFPLPLGGEGCCAANATRGQTLDGCRSRGEEAADREEEWAEEEAKIGKRILEEQQEPLN